MSSTTTGQRSKAEAAAKAHATAYQSGLYCFHCGDLVNIRWFDATQQSWVCRRCGDDIMCPGCGDTLYVGHDPEHLGEDA